MLARLNSSFEVRQPAHSGKLDVRVAFTTMRSLAEGESMKPRVLTLAAIWASPALAQENISLVCNYQFSTDDKGIRERITGQDSFRIQFLEDNRLQAQGTKCGNMGGSATDVRIILRCQVRMTSVVVGYEFRIDRTVGQMEVFVSRNGKIGVIREGHCKIK